MEEEIPKCMLCEQMFREPVMLPCQHSFCRECIRLFADQSKSRKTEGVSSKAEREKVEPAILCPQCRAPTSLGQEGVAGLPFNSELAKVVESSGCKARIEGNIPFCSVCEEDKEVKADKFCSTCCVLYCADCLATCHPMKGGLKRHRLIPAEQYIPQGGSVIPPDTAIPSDSDLACERHSQSLVMYCVTCQELLCLGCLGEHPLHMTRDIKSASEEDKVKRTA